MALTRAQVEYQLVRRCGRLMIAAGLDGERADGTNTDLNGPLLTALLKIGLSVSDPSNVADADIAGVATTDYAIFLDYSELRTLEDTLGNLDIVDITVGPRRESLSQLARQIQGRIDRLRATIEKEYGVGGATLQAGNIDLNFAAKGDDDVIVV